MHSCIVIAAAPLGLAALDHAPEVPRRIVTGRAHRHKWRRQSTVLDAIAMFLSPLVANERRETDHAFRPPPFAITSNGKLLLNIDACHNLNLEGRTIFRAIELSEDEAAYAFRKIEDTIMPEPSSELPSGLSRLRQAGSRAARSGSLRLVLAEPLANGRSVPDDPKGFPVLRLSALRDKYVNFSEHKLGAWTAKQAAPFVVQEGDLLFVRGNGAIRLVGRACIAGKPPSPIAFPDTSIRGRPDLTLVEPLWLWYAWESRLVRQQIESKTRTSAGIYKISQDDLYGIQLPLPTLEEQRCLLAKLEHWMKLCDDLEASLRRRDERAIKLAEAIVSEVVR
jgi:hypothetical protein